MCLLVNKEETEKIRAKKVRTITVWKLVQVDGRRVLSPIVENKINAGWYKSDRETAEQTSDEQMYVSKGIHVYRNRSVARSVSFPEYGEAVVKATALLKDFVACGDHEAVFTKIWIPKSELDRIRKRKR